MKNQSYLKLNKLETAKARAVETDYLTEWFTSSVNYLIIFSLLKEEFQTSAKTHELRGEKRKEVK